MNTTTILLAYGPANWHRLAPLCKGKHQSPIDLSASTAAPRPLDGGGIELLGLEYIIRGKLSNNGKTLGFTIDNTVDNIEGNDNEVIKLKSQGKTFVLKQFHMHFSCEGPGSEHSIDGERSVGEVSKETRKSFFMFERVIFSKLSVCPQNEDKN